MEIKYIKVNKNRGWRGLAKLECLDNKGNLITDMVFSFSQPVWDDLVLHHKIVIQHEEYYYVIYFKDELDRLPKPTQQRSVLIKNFYTEITNVNRIERARWSKCCAEDYNAIVHFNTNKNNHTQSDWNCIGVRVVPEI